MGTFRFIMRPSKDDLPKSIQFRYSQSRENVYRVQLPIKVRPSEWDSNNDRVRNNSASKRTIQPRLDVLMRDLEEIEWKNNDLSFKAICELMGYRIKGNEAKEVLPVHNLHDAYEMYVQTQNLAKNTKKHYKTSINAITRVFGDDLSFDFLDTHRIMLFKQKMYERNLKDDSIAKHIKCISRIMKWSYEMGYHSNDEFKKSAFRMGYATKVDNITLTSQEVAMVLNVSIPEHIEKVRDLFQFMVYTGQRFSDCQNFSMSNYDGEAWTYYPSKTIKKMVKVRVPFIGPMVKAKEIIEKYQGVPKMSGPHFNRSIKEVCRFAGIDSVETLGRMVKGKMVYQDFKRYECVTSHTCRRTFITLMLSYGVPMHIIMSITGHRTLKTISKYIHNNNDEIERAIKKVAW